MVNQQTTQSFKRKIQNKTKCLQDLTHLRNKYLLELFSMNLIENAPEKDPDCE
jgi:hypothetical protein